MDSSEKKKTYKTPHVQSPDIIAVVPLALIGVSLTMLEMAGVGALAGAAAVGVSKALGFHDYRNVEALLPTE